MRSLWNQTTRACLLAGFSVVINAGIGHAADKTTPSPSKTLKLVSLEFPPMVYANEEGKPEGVSVAMVKAIFWELGYRTEIEIHRWQESLKLVKAGKADGIFTIYDRPDRKSFIQYSKETLIQQPVALFKKSGAKVTFDGDFVNLKGKTIGTTGAITYGMRFDAAVKRYGLKTLNAATLDASFNNLETGKVDVVISSLFPAQALISKNKLADMVELLAHPVEITPSYFGFTKAKDLGDLPAQFDAALADFKKQGRYTKLLKKFDLTLPESFIRNYRAGLAKQPAE